MVKLQNKRLLLIEDDLPLAELIADFLSEQGIRVWHAVNGAQALQYARQHPFDLVICDLMLPDTHGFMLAERLQAVCAAPLMFLTAVGDDLTHVQALDTGAVDFINKPVKPQILLARIKTCLRHSRRSDDNAMAQLGDYQFDERSKSLSVNGKAVPLTNQEFDILWLFIKNPEQPVSRDHMFEQIVGRPYDGTDRAADLKVCRLRKKLEACGCGDIRISTLRGQGYILTLVQDA